MTGLGWFILGFWFGHKVGWVDSDHKTHWYQWKVMVVLTVLYLIWWIFHLLFGVF